MNEEELENEIIDKLLSERFDKPVKNGTMPCVIFSRQEFIKGMKYCFQKGKLEQKKEELRFLLELLSVPFENMRKKKECQDELCPNRYETQRLLNIKIKQLQKEIRGIK